MLASDVMNAAAGLLNDTSLSIFTYTSQIPFLNMALVELQEEMETNNVPAVNEVSASILIVAGVKVIDANTLPILPTNLLEIQGVGERQAGTIDDFIEVRRVEFLPMTELLTAYLGVYSWQDQGIHFIGSNLDREIKLNYLSDVGSPIVLPSDAITLMNCKSYLMYRTAALCAFFIGENETRAAALDMQAQKGLDRFLNINTKGRQAIAVRRRPFMANSRRTIRTN